MSLFSKMKASSSTLDKDSFDSRSQWSGCIGAVRDQGHCGSCWAFSATEVLADRACIEHNIKTVLSPQDLVWCDNDCFGCQGGSLQGAWAFFYQHGVHSEQCMPYEPLAMKSCPNGTCSGNGNFNRVMMASDYSSFDSINEIKNEIKTNGPVQSAFTVYADFKQ